MSETQTHRLTETEIITLRSTRFHKTRPCSQTGRRLKIRGGMATVVASYCCVAGWYSGYAHLDSTPHDQMVVVRWRE